MIDDPRDVAATKVEAKATSQVRVKIAYPDQWRYFSAFELKPATTSQPDSVAGFFG